MSTKCSDPAGASSCSGAPKCPSTGCDGGRNVNVSAIKVSSVCMGGVAISRDDLKKQLSPLQYQVTQEKSTERAFTGKYYKLKAEGIYRCVVCSEELFSSKTKYDSGSGWPAFFDVIDKGKVRLKQDLSHVGGNILLIAMNPGLVRTEVSCANCHAHLGHVFDDGPKPTGKRFCVNSAALDFIPDEEDTRSQQENGNHCNGAAQTS